MACTCSGRLPKCIERPECFANDRMCSQQVAGKVEEVVEIEQGGLPFKGAETRLEIIEGGNQACLDGLGGQAARVRAVQAHPLLQRGCQALNLQIVVESDRG